MLLAILYGHLDLAAWLLDRDPELITLDRDNVSSK